MTAIGGAQSISDVVDITNEDMNFSYSRNGSVASKILDKSIITSHEAFQPEQMGMSHKKQYVQVHHQMSDQLTRDPL